VSGHWLFIKPVSRRKMDVMKSSRQIPLNFFGIAFGLLGLADSWLVAAEFGLVPVGIGRGIAAVATAVWALVMFVYVRGKLANGSHPFADFTDPVLGPFASLAVLTPMLASADALHPYSHTPATVIVDALSAATVILAGWFVGEWIDRPLDISKVHAGYFLPGVAGGFVASSSLSAVGQTGLATVLFGVGLLSWLVIGSIIIGRLILGPPLPTPLIPTTAIAVAPAGVGTFAAFAMNGGHVDLMVKMLAAYGLLMVVAQLRLVPVYVRLRFMPSFWSFTFAWAAVAFAGESWLGITRPFGWHVELLVVLVLITTLIGAIAARTLVALRRGQLLPPVAASAAPTAKIDPARPGNSEPTPVTASVSQRLVAGAH
jgi:tellurite resistance protein